MQVEVNGVMYEPIARASQATGKSSKTLAMLSTMAAMFGGMSMYGGSTPKARPQVDIVKEYGLIQLKQSKLSSNERNWVKYKFEKTYKKVVD